MIMQHKRAMQDMQLLWEKALQQHRHGYDSSTLGSTSCGAWRWTRLVGRQPGRGGAGRRAQA